MAVEVGQRLTDGVNVVRGAVWAVILVGLAAIPFVLPSWQAGLVIELLVLVLFAASYDLLIGYTGVISFGHALPYGTAAYLMGMTMAGRPIPFVPTESLGFLEAVLIGVVAVVVVSVATGYLALQLSGVYFAMVTLAFSMVGYYVVFENTRLTGGDNGLLITRPEVFGVALFEPATFYYVTVAVVIGSYLALRRLTTSPVGQVLKSIRENEERARFLGYDTFRYKLFAFVVAGLFAGIAGMMQGLYINIVTPSMLYWSTGGDALLVTLIGGMGTLWGSAVGAVFLMGARQSLTGITESWPIILGIVYVLVVIFFPSGIAGLVTRTRSAWDVLRDLRP